MKLFLLSQKDVTGYNCYTRVLVAAPDEEAAQRTHPESDPCDSRDHWGSEMQMIYSLRDRSSGTVIWPTKPEDVAVKYLGEAAEGISAGVIMTDFHEA
jgi:hypothetical protein